MKRLVLDIKILSPIPQNFLTWYIKFPFHILPLLSLITALMGERKHVQLVYNLRRDWRVIISLTRPGVPTTT